MKTLLLWIFLTLFLFTTGFSQTAVNSAGGDASSPQGSVAYSIGYYSSSVDAVDGSVYTGPQIPVEFYGGCDDAANILYVIPTATGANNGTSWTDAFTNLQDALNSDCPFITEIWVAAGIYYPDQGTGQTDDDRTATFQLKNGVAIYGGFDGSETMLSERDWETNETILSGDIDQSGDLTGNSYTVVTGSGTDNTSVIDGFTISDGRSNGPGGSATPDQSGAGVFCSNGSPTINNCLITNSHANQRGGGMYNVTNSSPVITNCTFHDNIGGNGGGVYNREGSSPVFTNCIFSENSADIGGGMRNLVATPVVYNSTFINNTANNGGGVRNSVSSAVFINCLFAGNDAVNGGGIQNASTSDAQVINTTIAGNTASGIGGGVQNFDNSSPTLTNCIVWGNTSSTDGNQFHIDGGTTSLNYSIYNNETGDVSGTLTIGTGNIASDPLFVDEANSDYSLQACSPAINAGTPDTTGLNLPSTDLDGNPRFYNGGIVDMGAYELQADPLDITNVTTTNEGCPGANDGTITVSATCGTCAGGDADIRYSLDNIDFTNTTGVFTGLADGSYTVYVQDVNDGSCSDSDGPYTISAGVDVIAPTISCGTGIAGNMLFNNSFEIGTVHDQQGATGWASFGFVFAQDGNIFPSAQDGNFFMKMFGSNTGVFQDHPVNPGDEFRASVYVRNASFDPILPGCQGFMKLEYYNGGGGLISETQSLAIDNTQPLDVWTQITLDDTAPAGAAIVRMVVMMQCTTGGAVMFDNASLGTIVPVGDIAVNVTCPSEIPAPDVNSILTSDNCGSVTVTHEGDVSDGGFNPETITRTYRATDDLGNFSECTQSYIVEDNVPPVAICPTTSVTVILDEFGNGTLAANALAEGNSTDNCGAGPVETSPEVSFTCNDAPTAMVMLTAIDDAGNLSTVMCTVNIDASNCDSEPANNDCASAQSLSVATYPSTSNALGTLFGSTNSGSLECAGSADGGDVFYTFNLPQENHVGITVNPFAGADAVVEVLDGCAGTLIACLNNEGAGVSESELLENLAAGTYTVRVHNAGGTAEPAGSASFLINVQQFPYANLQSNPAATLYGCNTTDRQLEDFVGAEPQTGQFAGILDYRWLVGEVGGGDSFEWQRFQANYATRLDWLGMEYSATYNVFVQMLINHPTFGPVWTVYDGNYTNPNDGGASSCTIATSGSVTFTEVLPAYQGTNVDGDPYELCDFVVASNVLGADNFRWIFSPDVTPGNLDDIVYTRGSGNPSVRLSWVNGLQPGVPYNVFVEARVSGLWSSYVTSHSITLAGVPNVAVRLSYCGDTYAPNGYLLAESVCEADWYRFKFTPQFAGATREKASGSYALAMGTINPLLEPGDYYVQVQVSQNGTIGDYSPSMVTSACEITISGMPTLPGGEAPVAQRSETFGNATLFPNPNAGSEVRMELDGLSDGNHEVMIQVYDIYGKLIQTDGFGHQGNRLSRLLRFENELAMGMYMVQVVVDGERFATERMIVK